MKIFGLGYKKELEAKLAYFINQELSFIELNQYNIKSLLKNEFTSISKQNNEYIFCFDKDIALKSLLGDIEYFNLRVLDQYSNLKKNQSQSWDFVTKYYLYFFMVTTILRFNLLGNLFLSTQEADEITTRINILNSTPISLSRSNYSYEVKIEDGSNIASIVLRKEIKGTHEKTWGLFFEKVIKKMQSKSLNGESEELFLKALVFILTKLENQYLSKMRNIINYQPSYGLKSLKNELSIFNHLELSSDDLLKGVVNYKLGEEYNNDETRDVFFNLYGNYINMLYKTMYSEFLKRRDKKYKKDLKNILKEKTEILIFSNDLFE